MFLSNVHRYEKKIFEDLKIINNEIKKNETKFKLKIIEYYRMLQLRYQLNNNTFNCKIAYLQEIM